MVHNSNEETAATVWLEAAALTVDASNRSATAIKSPQTHGCAEIIVRDGSSCRYDHLLGPRVSASMAKTLSLHINGQDPFPQSPGANEHFARGAKSS